MSDSIKKFSTDRIYKFLQSVLKAVNVRDDVAVHVADGLLNASLRGVDSHGIRLLPHYIASVEGGRLNPNPQYKFERTASAAGTFDADHTFGHAAGIEAMRKAVDMAREAGAGLVSVYNSSHCGTSAFFAVEAAKKDFIGLAFTHANALLNTPGSTRPFFGLNPIAMAVPCEGEEPFCYDSAPSVITWNRLLQLRQENLDAPVLSGADENGSPTSYSHKVTQLLPIGGYKGFGLAMIVDILCGLLTGMKVGRDIPDMYKTPLSEKRHLGQFYMAIKIDAFQPLGLFKKRMKKLMDDIRNEPGRDADTPVMSPGDPEKKNLADRTKNGIPVKELDLNAFKALAEKYKIKFFGSTDFSVGI
ncbi:MAG: Ldh family oxidoreductase [Nitrospirae bacterium]|nr:Ldh family oxidoreductase [Nitrospirota bacterium]